MTITDQTLQQPFHARNVVTLTDSVQQEIERQILIGEIKAGEKLSESKIAQSLGVSRGPVREAMRGLKEAGLVDIVANKGVIVRAIGLDEVIDLYDLRGSLFAFTCETLARRCTDEHRVMLQGMIDQMVHAYGDGDRELYYRINIEFHAAIVDFCGNRRAKQTYNSIVKEMHLFRRRGLMSTIENIESSIKEHTDIAEAIFAGDPIRASQAGAMHLANGKERFLATLDAAIKGGTDKPEE